MFCLQPHAGTNYLFSLCFCVRTVSFLLTRVCSNKSLTRRCVRLVWPVLLFLAYPVPLTNFHFNEPLDHLLASFPVVECSHAWPHPVTARVYICWNLISSTSPADWPCISHLDQIRLALLHCCYCFRCFWALYCCVGAL